MAKGVPKEEPEKPPKEDVKEQKPELGVVVTHKSFGDGKIIKIIPKENNKKYLTIDFTHCVKNFIFPDAFRDGYLTYHKDSYQRNKDEGLEFSYDPLKGTYEVSNYTGSATEVVIPSIYCGSTVTCIGNGAFAHHRSLISITIPNGVTSIDALAFANCTNLTSITFGENSKLTSIGDCAFKGCSSLTSITIPNSVTSIGSWTFFECNLTSITIPDSVTSIGGYAFYNCRGLTSVTIPDSVTSIGDCAFSGCKNITSIHFGGTKAQWNSITNSSNWKYGIPRIIVYFNDGTSITVK